MHAPQDARLPESIGENPPNQAGALAPEIPIRRLFAQGDRGAAEAICRSLFTATLGRYCMATLGDSELAARVVAEIWDPAMQDLQRLDENISIRSTLLGLARRRCAYALETSKNPTGSATGSESLDGAGAGKTHQRPELARRLLQQLSPSEREMLILRYVCLLSYEEIGTIWRIDVGEVKRRVSLALARATSLSKRQEPKHV